MSTPATLPFDAMVEAMVRAGVPRDRAELRARAELGIAAPSGAGVQLAEPDAEAREKEEQHECYKIFRAFGGKVRNLSQARRTKQAPGLGDAWIVFRVVSFACWWETKRQDGGRHSGAQLEMREDCAACGVAYETGDRYAAAELVIRLGLAYRAADGTLEPIRNREGHGE